MADKAFRVYEVPKINIFEDQLHSCGVTESFYIKAVRVIASVVVAAIIAVFLLCEPRRKFCKHGTQDEFYKNLLDPNSFTPVKYK